MSLNSSSNFPRLQIKVQLLDDFFELGARTDSYYRYSQFQKDYKPGAIRPGSLPSSWSYRMRTRELAGKTHCELEEIIRAKA